MASNGAATPEGYLAGLPEDRRATVARVRDVVVRNLPQGIREGVGFGMLAYVIPLEDYPDTYNGQPLCFAGLAAQKNHYALYLTSAYSDPREAEWLAEEFRKVGKKLDMGKSCLRFRSIEDLPLEVVGRFIRRGSAKKFIEQYEASRLQTAAGRRAIAKETKAIAKETKATATKTDATATKPKATAPKTEAAATKPTATNTAEITAMAARARMPAALKTAGRGSRSAPAKARPRS